MSNQALAYLVYALTAAAALDIALTRRRLSDTGAAAGRFSIAAGPVRVHTVAGVGALLTWVVLLVGGDGLGEDAASLLGLVSLVLWWTVTLAGLLLLLRWLPARGRHAAPAASDTWSRGPGLSLLAHLGMLGGALVFTWAYLVGAV
ncbi:hypothetical protein [Nocardioides sp.]|uniref:hypothetical protein n=1 Tax=Nocardioides sp. TaxID=35761 RepID=UPI003517939E